VLPYEIVEDHEVGEQDLVHASPGVEAMEIVLRRLGLHVARLVRQLRAQGVDPLTLGLEHPGDRVLGEPVDLEVGHEPPQLLGDRDVTPCVPEPDR
jgi:hypothetical protein